MQNGFNAEFGVDSSSLQLLVNPLVMLEEKEEEEIKKRNDRKSSVVSEQFDVSDFFRPKFRYVRHKKMKVILKRIRF